VKHIQYYQNTSKSVIRASYEVAVHVYNRDQNILVRNPNWSIFNKISLSNA